MMEKLMNKKTPRSQGSTRYHLTHPTLSTRVTLTERDKILKIAAATNLTVAEIFRNALLYGTSALTNAHSIGYNQGYNDARTRYGVIYPCAVCGKPIEAVSENSKAFLVEALRQARWVHAACAKQAT
jgi:hypothetical protein